MNNKSYILLKFLLDYYRNNLAVLNYFITQKSFLSLRILDWLVTNYSKKYNINYTIIRNNKEYNFNIFLEYKNQLKAYSKKLFDPFCRRERLLLNIKDLTYIDIGNDDNNLFIQEKNDYIVTTIGQLNFFKWFIENEVLNYVIVNMEIIDRDMIKTLDHNKIDNQNKRKELSSCAFKNISNINKPILVEFK